MKDQIELVVTEKPVAAGFRLAVAVSAVVHGLLAWLVWTYKPELPPPRPNAPIARYVELMRQNPKEFTEAPGQKVEQKPLNAPFSNANRRASMPNPTGDQPTLRPGDGRGMYQPPTSPEPRGPQAMAATPPIQQQAQRPQQQQQQAALAPNPAHTPATPIDDSRLTFRQPTMQASAVASPASAADWTRAIQQAGKAAVRGGGDGVGADPNRFGGEKGYAEQGPLSFETQWYDWGDYAQSMVSRIRVNWYAGMPQLIRSGIQGKVTIRFTIQRDGRITDVTMLESSGAPPYDFAAKKAIEQSSPLNPLPKDFPNPYERVTAVFYYNMEIPGGG